MKNFLPLSLLFVLFISCSDKKDPAPAPPVNNILFDTRWQTEDFVAKIIYGGACFQVYHFIDNSTFEIYSTRNGQIRSHDHEGTYSITDKKVSIKYIDDKGKEVTGSYIFVNSGTLERDPSATVYSTYIKQ